MAYAQIDISQVGPPELPLIGVLCQAIFGPAGDFPSLQRIAQENQSAYLLIAHLEGNPLGYLVASSRDGAFVVASSGVLPDYAGKGIEQRMLDLARGEAKRRAQEMLIAPGRSPPSGQSPSDPPSPGPC